MVAILVALCLHAAEDLIPEVAFTARFYYSPGDHRVSHHQVYVCDLYGSHRRQLTRGNVECDMVRWVGPTTLAWVQRLAGSVDNLGYRTAPGKPSKLIEYNLTTGRRLVLCTGHIDLAESSVGFIRSRTGKWPRGRPVYSNGGGFWTSSGNGLKREGTKPTIAVCQLRNGSSEHDDVNESWSLPGHVAVEDISYTKEPTRVTRSDGSSQASSMTVIRTRSRRYEVPATAVIDCFFASTKRNVAYWVDGAYAASAGSEEDIYEINWTTGRSRKVIDALLDIDFSPDSPYCAGLDNDKMTLPWGKKRVWGRRIWVGDIRTGRRWTVTPETVHATSVSPSGTASPDSYLK